MAKESTMELRETVTFEDLEYLERCEHLFALNRTQAKRTEPTRDQKAAQVSGRAFHRASSAHESIRPAIIRQELSNLPEEERERVLVEIIESVEQADLSKQTEDSGLQNEFQLLWTDPRTGWTFAAKPDLYGDLEKEIIKENKRSRRFYDSHHFQVYFAAFIAAHIQLEKQKDLPPAERKFKPIEMTVRCSRFITGADGKKRRMWQQVFYFPWHKLERETERMRRSIRLIIRRAKADYFVPRLTMKACFNCPRRAECAPLGRHKPLIAQITAEEKRIHRPLTFPEPVTAVQPPTTEAATETPAPAVQVIIAVASLLESSSGVEAIA
jgi:hypothetical protein